MPNQVGKMNLRKVKSSAMSGESQSSTQGTNQYQPAVGTASQSSSDNSWCYTAEFTGVGPRQPLPSLCWTTASSGRQSRLAQYHLLLLMLQLLLLLPDDMRFTAD